MATVSIVTLPIAAVAIELVVGEYPVTPNVTRSITLQLQLPWIEYW